MRLRRPVFFLAVAVFPLILTLQNPEWRESIHAASLNVMKPALNAGSALVGGVSGSKRALVQFWKTFRNQEHLEDRIAELESKLTEYQEAMAENERLKKLLDFKQTLTGKSIAARVIGWDLSPWRKTLVLDKGEHQGIVKDMAVVVPEGLVGRILETGASTSRVLLLTDADARVSAITEQTRAQGVVSGSGAPKLQLRYIPLDAGSSVDEIVMTAGGTGLFPKGIRIGKIEGIGRDIDGLHLVARVQPFVQFSKLEEVFCIKSSQEK